MERLTEWNDEQTRHAYYPRCFKDPCYGSGCKIKDCPFETAVCDRLAAYEDTGLSPEKVSWMKEVVEAAFDNDTSRIERAHNLHVADKEGRVVVLPCKVGDMLYEVTGRKTISVYKVKAIRVELFEIFVEWNIVDGIVWQSLDGIGSGKIGKTVFLTREEAERALAEREGKKDG